MQLAGGGTCAWQACIVGSSGDAGDCLIACGLVGSRIGDEDRNRNSPSIRWRDENYVVGRVRHAIVYVGGIPDL